MVTSFLHAALQITSEAAAEGNDPAFPRVVRFTLTQSPPSSVPTTWEYVTSPDTAREGIDYVGMRGVVTIPALAETAVVEVPLIPDRWKEADESFSLVVWPQGGAPTPVFQEILRPPADTPGFAGWRAGEVGVSEDSCFFGISLGHNTEGVWAHEMELWSFSRSPLASPTVLAGNARWMAMVEVVGDTLSANAEMTRFSWTDRRSLSSPPPISRPPLFFTGAPEDIRSVTVQGDVAGVFSFGIMRFFQLHPDAAPLPLGQCHLSGATHVIFDGRRIAAATTTPKAVTLYESGGPDLVHWKQIVSIPTEATLLALDGDHLVLRSATGPFGRPILHVHERTAGGPNAWGQSVVLNVGDEEPDRPMGPIRLAGRMLYIADGTADVGAGPRPGKIHALVKDAVGSQWTPLGSFQSPAALPGDTFGSRLAAAGSHILTTSEVASPFGSTTAWMGTWPGSMATVLDDDVPEVRISEASEFEPSESVFTIKGSLRLSHPAAEPVSVTWRAVGGSASAGSDFAATESTTVIPGGALSAPIEVPVLPDALFEDDEFFSIEITAVAGDAATPGPPARWHLRDTDRAPVAFAANPVTYEGLARPQPDIEFQNVTEPISAEWNIREFPSPAPPRPVHTPGQARAENDFFPANGTLSIHSGGTHPISIVTSKDGTAETAEVATLALHLPPQVSAASYGTRLIHSITAAIDGGPGTEYHSRISTDGERVAVLTRVSSEPSSPDKGIHLFRRDTTAPDGWRHEKFLLLSDLGVVGPSGAAATWGYVIFRQGRLCYFDGQNGRAWILVQDPSRPDTWKIEATFLSRSGRVEDWTSTIEFDGQTFVASTHYGLKDSQIHVHERGEGDWSYYQELHVPGMAYPARFEGQTLVVPTSNGANAGKDVAIFERTGSNAARWERRPNLFLPFGSPAAALTPLLKGNVMVFPGYYDIRSTIFRRQDGGTWIQEQGLTATVIAMDRGVLLGHDAPEPNVRPRTLSFTDTGPPSNRWQQVPTSDSHVPPPYLMAMYGLSDICRNVIVGIIPLHTSPGTQPVDYGFYIAEPGVDLKIVDSDSFVLNLSAAEITEDRVETLSLINLSLTESESPIDIEIPFRTTADGTATPGVDFRPVSGTMVLKAGQKSTGFALPILPDGALEQTETIRIDLGPPSFGVVQPVSPVDLEIRSYPSQEFAVIMRTPPVIFEPADGQVTYSLPLSFTRLSAYPLTVEYQLSGQTAGAEDMVLGPASLTIPAGQFQLPIPLTVMADNLSEGSETVRLSIVSVNGIPAASNFNLVIHDHTTPGAASDSFSTPEGTSILAPSVLINDPENVTDPFIIRRPEWGSVTMEPDGTFQYTPPPKFLGTDRFAYTGWVPGTTLIAEDAIWRWFHPLNGIDPGTTVPGFQANWMMPGFDDSLWSLGGKLMGYGALGDLPGDPLTTNIGTPPSGSRYTAYFRTRFDAPADPGTALTLRFSCDDAAIFYVNGTEIARYASPPAGAFATAADTYHLLSTTFHDTTDETRVRVLSIQSVPLTPGPNVLAVSVHNTTATSSDLGFRLHEVTTGFQSREVLVEVNVTDAGLPPQIVDDFSPVRGTTTPLDSMFLLMGSAYANDGLLSPTGLPFLPILEAEIGGSPVGPVAFDKDTGHFRVTPPPSYFGATAFTYRVRNIHGWSNTATVTLPISPSRDFDYWRLSQFGGDSLNPLAGATADPEGDGLVNLAEFAFGTNPKTPDFAPILSLQRRSGAWIAEFTARPGFGRDAFIALESSTSLRPDAWSRLAWLNDAYPSAEKLAPGVSIATQTPSATRTVYEISMPPSATSETFFRLRVSQERHILDP